MINCIEVIDRVVNNPADPYGPPLVKYMVRVRDRDTRRWWYIRTVHHAGGGQVRRYTFTSDPTYARLMTFRTARRLQADIPTDALARC